MYKRGLAYVTGKVYYDLFRNSSKLMTESDVAPLLRIEHMASTSRLLNQVAQGFLKKLGKDPEIFLGSRRAFKYGGIGRTCYEPYGTNKAGLQLIRVRKQSSASRASWL